MERTIRHSSGPSAWYKLVLVCLKPFPRSEDVIEISNIRRGPTSQLLERYTNTLRRARVVDFREGGVAGYNVWACPESVK